MIGESGAKTKPCCVCGAQMNVLAEVCRQCGAEQPSVVERVDEDPQPFAWFSLLAVALGLLSFTSLLPDMPMISGSVAAVSAYVAYLRAENAWKLGILVATVGVVAGFAYHVELGDLIIPLPCHYTCPWIR